MLMGRTMSESLRCAALVAVVVAAATSVAAQTVDVPTFQVAVAASGHIAQDGDVADPGDGNPVFIWGDYASGYKAYVRKFSGQGAPMTLATRPPRLVSRPAQNARTSSSTVIASAGKDVGAGEGAHYAAEASVSLLSVGTRSGSWRGTPSLLHSMRR